MLIYWIRIDLFMEPCPWIRLFSKKRFIIWESTRVWYMHACKRPLLHLWHCLGSWALPDVDLEVPKHHYSGPVTNSIPGTGQHYLQLLRIPEGDSQSPLNTTWNLPLNALRKGFPRWKMSYFSYVHLYQ